MTQPFIGGCLCGQARYRIDAAPGLSRLCWCRDCQHLSSNGTVNVMFPTDRIEITGRLAEHRRTADSGNTVTRRFCPECGSHLFSDSSGRVGLTVVRVGTLDDPSSVTPTANIWARSAPAWACMDTALQRHDTVPPAAPAQPPR